MCIERSGVAVQEALRRSWLLVIPPVSFAATALLFSSDLDDILFAVIAPATKAVADLFPLPLWAIPRAPKDRRLPLSAALRLRCGQSLASCKVTIVAKQTRRRATSTNCFKSTSAHIETAKGVGSISTLTIDLDITVEPVASANPMAPTHRVLGRSPRGKLVECGGI